MESASDVADSITTQIANYFTMKMPNCVRYSVLTPFNGDYSRKAEARNNYPVYEHRDGYELFFDNET